MKNKPGPGALVAHGACCGIPLLILLALQAPAVLLFGGGLAVLGGAVLWLGRAWNRGRRYQMAWAKRRERRSSVSVESPQFLLGGASGVIQNNGSTRREMHRKKQGVF